MTINFPILTGDAVCFGLCSPSSWIEERWLSAFTAACAERELTWKFAPNALSRRAYKAGSAEERAQDFTALFEDEEVDVIVGTSGGFNSNEILERVDWKHIARRPKWFAGCSDLTTINAALLSQAGLASIYGFNAVYAKSDPSALDRLLLTLRTGQTQVRLPGKLWEWDRPEKRPSPAPKLLRGESPEGPVFAANLSTFNLLLGTPYLPALDGYLLCLEYDKEEAHALPSLERMLWQVRTAGLLSKVRALVFGTPQAAVAEEERALGRSIDDILLEVTEGLSLSVICNLPFGHISPSWQLINGKSLQLRIPAT